MGNYPEVSPDVFKPELGQLSCNLFLKHLLPQIYDSKELRCGGFFFFFFFLPKLASNFIFHSTLADLALG